MGDPTTYDRQVWKIRAPLCGAFLLFGGETWGNPRRIFKGGAVSIDHSQ